VEKSLRQGKRQIIDSIVSGRARFNTRNHPAATGGWLLGVWPRPLAVGAPLPTLRLPLSVGQGIPGDLERTYQQAAADAYLA
jgi:hypothetical protein